MVCGLQYALWSYFLVYLSLLLYCHCVASAYVHTHFIVSRPSL